MKLRDYPFEVVQFSCGKCLRNGRYKKSALSTKVVKTVKGNAIEREWRDNLEENSD